MSDPNTANGPESPDVKEADVPAAPALADVAEAPPEGSLAEASARRVRLAEDRLAEVLGAYRKLRLDNEGFRARTAKNLERRYEARREKLLLRFMDILDNLDRALEAAENSYVGEALLEGLILVRTQLLQTLKEEGLERIPALGLPFDPTVSEAVEMIPVEEPEQHQVVVKELQRGYRLNGRVARASRVVVGEHRDAAAQAAAASADERGEAPPPEGMPAPALNVSAEALAQWDWEPPTEPLVVAADAEPGLAPARAAWRPVETPLPAIIEKLTVPAGSSPESTLAAMPMPDPPRLAARVSMPPPAPAEAASAEPEIPEIELQALGPVEEEATPLAGLAPAAEAGADTSAQEEEALDIVDSLPPDLDTLIEEDPVPLGGRPEPSGRAVAPTLDEIIARALGPLGTDAADKPSRR